MQERDLDQLSAYLDNALAAEDRAAFETRLAADADLRRELERLRLTKNLIGTLPLLRPPRPLTLTRDMVAPPRVLVFPATVAFSAMSAAAAIIVLLTGVLLLATGRADQPTANIAQMATMVGVTAEAPVDLLLVTDEADDQSARTAVLTLAPTATITEWIAEEAAGGAAAPEMPAPIMGTLVPLPTMTAEAQEALLDSAPALRQATSATPEGALSYLLSESATPIPEAALELVPMAAMMITDTPSPLPTFALPTATRLPATATRTLAPSATPIPTPPPPATVTSGDGSSIGIALIVLAALLFLLSATAFMRRQ